MGVVGWNLPAGAEQGGSSWRVPCPEFQNPPTGFRVSETTAALISLPKEPGTGKRADQSGDPAGNMFLSPPGKQ